MNLTKGKYKVIVAYRRWAEEKFPTWLLMLRRGRKKNPLPSSDLSALQVVRGGDTARLQLHYL